jgi:lambda family phage tail tape measure protein
MSDTIASAVLEYTADSSGVTAAMAKATQAVEKFEQKATTSGKRAGETLQKTTKDTGTGTAALTREQERLIATIERYSTTVGKSRGEVLEYRASQAGITSQVQAQINAIKAQEAALRSTGKELNKYGISAGQQAAALRGVPAQVTDIVVGLQGGQAPLTVLLQQGGQLRDMFGGVAPAAKALGGAVAGLVNPFTLAAAAVAALGYAYYQSSERALEHAKALTVSGNLVGMTASQLDDVARAAGNIAGTQSNAAQAVDALVRSGQIGGEALTSVAAAVVAANKRMGTSVEDAVAVYVQLAEEPTKASAKLNDSMHYLDLATYQRIRTLEEQGNKEAAAAVAQTEYANATVARMEKVAAQAGLLSRTLSGVADVAAGMWRVLANGVGSIGAPNTAADDLQAAQRRLAHIQQFGGSQAAFDENRQQILESSKRYLRDINAAAAEAQRAIDNEAKIQSDIRLTALKKSVRSQEMIRADERKQILEDARRTGMSMEEANKLIALSEAKHKDPKGPAGTGRADMMAGTKLALEQIKAQSEAVTTANANTERVLEAQRAAGLVDEAAYYGEKRRLIEANTKAQVDALNAENARMQQDKLKTSDALDRDRKVAENLSKINKLQADGAAALKVLTIQQDAADRARAASLLTAQQAAQDFLDTTQRAYGRQLQGIGMGTSQRDYLSGVSQIEDRYEGQRRELRNTAVLLALEGKYTDEVRKHTEARLLILEDAQAKSLASWDVHYARLKQKDLDWSLGASEALNNYASQAVNVFQQTEQLITRAFGGMEDAIVSLVMTGKADFKSLINSILSDIARMTVRQGVTGPLAKMIAQALAPDELGDFLKNRNIVGAGGGGGGGFDWGSIGTWIGSLLRFEDGGRPPVGVPSIVGERGPELFIPSTAGTIVPNGALSNSGGSGNILISNFTTGRIDTVEERRLSNGDRELVLREVAAQIGNPNSDISKSLSRNTTAGRKR